MMAHGRARAASMAALLLGLGCAGQEGEVPASTNAGTVATEAETHEVDLYFPGADGRLHAERRVVAIESTPEEAISTLVNALLAGPLGENLWAPLVGAPEPEMTEGTAVEVVDPDEGVRLGLVRLLEDGTAVLDLRAPRPPAVGTREETLSLYSLVNTILLNLSEADRLILLWNGEQPQTFAGHIDTARPLTVDRSLIGDPAS